MWQEVFDNKDKVKEDTIVEVWKGGANSWGKTMSEVIRLASPEQKYSDILNLPLTGNQVGASWHPFITMVPQLHQVNMMR